ncbi:MAG: helix-turn-helix domain-containing protein [Chthonomonas sp.]|nr:helix-turn-helix domain-containing protein [Chthonomonas sp.]
MSNPSSRPPVQRLAYTVQEAAALLSLSRSLVYELINAGKIDTIKIGRARRITSNQLEKYLQECEHLAPGHH